MLRHIFVQKALKLSDSKRRQSTEIQRTIAPTIVSCFVIVFWLTVLIFGVLPRKLLTNLKDLEFENYEIENLSVSFLNQFHFAPSLFS